MALAKTCDVESSNFELHGQNVLSMLRERSNVLCTFFAPLCMARKVAAKTFRPLKNALLDA